MIKKIRLDLYLLNKGLCETRQKAQGIILAGKVKDINGKIYDKPGQQVIIGSEFFIESEPQFVSRGGEKLLEAFKKLEINVKDKVCIDAGISTGGFTDCLLKRGAALIYGIDVGYGQTDWSIRNDPRVILRERTNIRSLKSCELYRSEDPYPNFAVADVSFISLRLVLPAIKSLLLASDPEALVLVKPQFEVGRELVSKGGVVRNKKAHIDALTAIVNFSKLEGWIIRGILASPLTGPAGNHEYLLWLGLKGVESNLNLEELVNNTLGS